MICVKNVSAYLDESFILRMRVVPRSEQISSSLFGDGDFLCNRKLCSITTKSTKSTKSWIMLDKKEGGIPWQNFITIR